MTQNLFTDLAQRGIIFQHTPTLIDEGAKNPLTVYLGIDPTGDSLHIGHYFGLSIMKRFYQAGHKVILLAGGGTALIGDPGGKNAERPILAKEVIEANKIKLGAQMRRLIGLHEQDFVFVDNADWLASITLMDFLRDAGKHINISHMLDKETVKTRLAADGISYAEFSYQLLQAYDYLMLNKMHGCTLQIGGSDQWGNIIQGVELIRKATGGAAHALCFPLITDPRTGRKFGKTEGGAGIWLDSAKTHPYMLYQFLVNQTDDIAPQLLKFLSFKSLSQIEQIESSWVREKRTLQKELAFEILQTVYGEDVAQSAKEITETIFAGDLGALTPSNLEFVKTALPHTKIASAADFDLATCAVALGLCASRGEARRLMEQNGLRQIGIGNYIIIQRGKRDLGVVEVAEMTN